MVAPQWTLAILGFDESVLTARIVAAAFLATGGISLLAHSHSAETYRALLLLKILWSLFAVLGIVITLIQGTRPMAFGVLLTFAFFSGIWLHYWRKMGCRL